MIILGIDPGSQITGYGFIRATGASLSWLGSGVLRPLRGAPLPSRLRELHDGLAALLDERRPDVVALEECFMGRHARAALVLGHARGALMVAALARDIPLAEYAPRLVKQAVTGVGSAGKHQIQAMVPRLLAAAPAEVGPDEADALAVAICHAHRHAVASTTTSWTPGTGPGTG